MQLWSNHNYSWLQPVRIDKRFHNFMDTSTFPTFLQLHADDGGIQHAVPIVGKLVCDSNCAHALLLNQATIDYCCSSDDQPSHYSHIYGGYRFNVHGTKEKYGRMLERNKVILQL